MDFEEEKEILNEDDFFGWLADVQHEEMILGLWEEKNEKGDKYENNNEGQDS